MSHRHARVSRDGQCPATPHRFLAHFASSLLLTVLLAWPFAGRPATVDDAALAPTPPMGWNSWNHFGTAVTAADIRDAADELVSSGMAAAGYRYVIVDDGWQGKRDAQGKLRPNAKFPDMKALVDYVHARGLKFGIYSSPGKRTCGGYAGSLGHEAQDARTFAGWGVDYLKYDMCSFTRQLVGKPPARQVAMMKAAYLRMRRALDATGRPIVYALCNAGWGQVWRWGAAVGGNLWRSSVDIQANYQSVLFNASSQLGLERYAGPGHWNDPDMLEIGNSGLDELAVERTQMSLWSLLAAPLIAGNDLSKMGKSTRLVLVNREVIEVDQDSLGGQGRRVTQVGPLQIWMRVLARGDVVGVLLNTLDHPLYGVFNFEAMGLHGSLLARDLWQHRNLGRIDSSHLYLVPAHGVVMIRFDVSKS